MVTEEEYALIAHEEWRELGAANVFVQKCNCIPNTKTRVRPGEICLKNHETSETTHVVYV